MTGKIVSIVADKGFFFLRPEGSNTDFFAHKDELPKGERIEHLCMGDVWEFDVVPDAPKGPRATALRKPVRTLDTLLSGQVDG